MVLWLGFFALITLTLVIDLGVFNRKPHIITFKESILWTSVWVVLAFLFNAYIFYNQGSKAGLEFLTGYIVEKSLSIDNVFIFITIFQRFKIPLQYQHRVLFWGVIGAILFRGLFISLGVTLVTKFNWIFYIFGLFLLYTSFQILSPKTYVKKLQDQSPSQWLSRYIPISPKLEGAKFITKKNGRWQATPLLMALLSIEVADIIFALDSIPAIFAITQDFFIVFTSNIFAILGLRALYFVMVGLTHRLQYLSYALAFILGFIGIKMLVHNVYKVPGTLSLIIILGALLSAVGASLLGKKTKH